MYLGDSNGDKMVMEQLLGEGVKLGKARRELVNPFEFPLIKVHSHPLVYYKIELGKIPVQASYFKT